ncbi:translation initiation factor [Patulibacter americanus]|uniref:translation initiation factor n=1 Tax=Patulibacter americanus TaxID=588672 RepID=UPI0003B779D5|nr:translation initiation factor [Patulibacter americanus]
MARIPRRDEQLVWSSDGGDVRRDKGKGKGKARGGAPAGGGGGAPAGGPTAAGSRVKVRRETAGRRGKTATTVSGVPLDEDGLRDLAGRLKKRCGVGGSAKDGVIELQGDHRDVVLEVLKGEGYDAVLAGG